MDTRAKQAYIESTRTVPNLWKRLVKLEARQADACRRRSRVTGKGMCWGQCELEIEWVDEAKTPKGDQKKGGPRRTDDVGTPEKNETLPKPQRWWTWGRANKGREVLRQNENWQRRERIRKQHPGDNGERQASQTPEQSKTERTNEIEEEERRRGPVRHQTVWAKSPLEALEMALEGLGTIVGNLVGKRQMTTAEVERVERLRQRQRALLLQWTQMSERQGARLLRKILVLNPARVETCMNSDEQALVYALINIKHGRCRYVGRTRQPRNRARQHAKREVRDTPSVKLAKKGGRTTATDNHYAKVQASGEAGQWVMMPLFIGTRWTTDEELARLEKRNIKEYGTRNVVGRAGRTRTHVTKTRRRRAVINLRGGKEKKRGPVEEARPTTYTYDLGGVRRTTTDLLDILRNIENGPEDEVKVNVNTGTYDVSRYVTAKRVHGETEIEIGYVDGRECYGKIRNRALWRRPGGGNIDGRVDVAWIRVGPVKRAITIMGEGGQAALLRKLVTASDKGNRLLGGQTYKQMTKLQGMCRRITDARARQVVQGHLRRHTKRVWGHAVGHSLCVKVESTEPRVKRQALRAARRVVDGLQGLTRNQRADLRSNVKAVQTRPCTVGGELARWRTWCKDFDPDNKPKCT